MKTRKAPGPLVGWKKERRRPEVPVKPPLPRTQACFRLGEERIARSERACMFMTARLRVEVTLTDFVKQAMDEKLERMEAAGELSA